MHSKLMGFTPKGWVLGLKAGIWASRLGFLAAALKGMRSCRTQGYFCSSVHMFVRPSISPPSLIRPLRPQIRPLRPQFLNLKSALLDFKIAFTGLRVIQNISLFGAPGLLRLQGHQNRPLTRPDTRQSSCGQLGRSSNAKTARN